MTQLSYAKECHWMFGGERRCISSCKTNVILPTLLDKTQVYYWTKNVQKHPLCIDLTIPLQCWPLSEVCSMSLATSQYEQCLNFFMAAQRAFKSSSALPTVLNKKQANAFFHFLFITNKSNHHLCEGYSLLLLSASFSQ